MSVTVYDPDPVYTAGNTSVAIVKTIADINAPTLAELNVSSTVKIECAIENFGVTTDVSTVDRKKLCNRIASKSIGARTYAMDDILIAAGDPQAENQARAALPVDSIVYLVYRPGVEHTKAFTADEKVMVAKIIVGAVDDNAVTTADGEEFAFTLKPIPLDRSAGLVAIAS